MTDTESAPAIAPEAVTSSSTKPEYLVVENKLVVQTEQGELKFPLALKTGLVRAVRKADIDEIDQFFLILDSLGDTSTIAKLDELDIMKTAEIVGRFFVEFEKRQGATLGEASGSSAS